MSLPFQVRQSTNKDFYGTQLSSIHEGHRLHEQSISLASDPNAYKKMLSDATISSLVQMRRHMVAGARWQMVPASDSPTDKLAAAHMEKLFAKIKRFDTARYNLAQGVFTGSSYARVNGSLTYLPLGDGQWRNWWVPTDLQDVGRLRFDKVATKVDVGTPSERYDVKWRQWDYVKRQWMEWEHPEWYVKYVYNDDESTLGYGSGLIDAMYFYWRAKEILFRSGLQGAERWAQGFLMASVYNARNGSTGKTNQAIVNAFIRELEKQRTQHFFVKDKDDEIELIDGPGRGYEIVQWMIDYVDTQLRLLILGSNLPTQAEGGGSYALGEIQRDTMDALIEYDRLLLAEALSDLVKLVWDVNRVNFLQMGLGAAEMPKLKIYDDRKINPKEMAEMLQTLINAGFKIKVSEGYPLVNLTPPGPDDDIIESPGAGMLGGGSDFIQGPGGRLQGSKGKPGVESKPPGADGGGDDKAEKFMAAGMPREQAIYWAKRMTAVGAL